MKSGRAFLAKAVHAPGVVIDLERRHSSDGADTFAPVVEFEHEGRRFRFADSVSSRPASYRPGDRVGVLFDPGNPRDARIDRDRWNRAIPIFIGCFGLLFCAVGLLVVRKRSTSRVG